MTTVHDIAAYILRARGPMTAMKLQKLIYYSQAWSLARSRRALFPEKLRAWANGPVVYELFDRHRRQFVVTQWDGDPDALPALDRPIVDWVLTRYGALSGERLSALTHAEAPWREARAGMPVGSPSHREISHDSMRAFYSTHHGA